MEHAREIIDQELTIKDDKNSSAFKLTVKKPIEIKKFLDEIFKIELEIAETLEEFKE